MASVMDASAKVAARAPQELADDYLDANGYVWTSGRIRFYLAGMSDRLVDPRRGRLSEAHLDWWWKQTEADPELWLKVDAAIRQEALIARTRLAYASSDQSVMKAVHQMIKTMEEAGEL